MKTTTIEVVLESFIKILEAEQIDLESITFNLQANGEKVPVPFSKLIDLAKKDLEQIQTESTRLDFLVENRLRVERWNTSPCTEFYYVMNDEDVSITQHEDLRTAVDLAMEQLKKEEEEQ